MGFDTVDRIKYSDLNIDFEICGDYRSHVFLTKDNTVFKKFSLKYLISLLDDEYDIEEKVLNASGLVNTPEVLIPSSAVYDNGNFIGYTMPFFDGTSIYDIDFYDGNIIFDCFYLKLENIIKNSENIVFPDLISCGNILVNDDSICLIDFDGLQISDYASSVMCSSLGDCRLYNNTKYFNHGLFTKELDIKSLIYLYFDLKFDCGLWNLNLIKSYDDCFNKLEEMFNYHNIYNNDLFEKVLRLYDDSKPNVYLNDTIDSIFNNYDIDYDLYSYSGVKKLVRK